MPDRSVRSGLGRAPRGAEGSAWPGRGCRDTGSMAAGQLPVAVPGGCRECRGCSGESPCGHLRPAPGERLRVRRCPHSPCPHTQCPHSPVPALALLGPALILPALTLGALSPRTRTLGTRTLGALSPLPERPRPARPRSPGRSAVLCAVLCTVQGSELSPVTHCTRFC